MQKTGPDSLGEGLYMDGYLTQFSASALSCPSGTRPQH